MPTRDTRKWREILCRRQQVSQCRRLATGEYAQAIDRAGCRRVQRTDGRSVALSCAWAREYPDRCRGRHSGGRS